MEKLGHDEVVKLQSRLTDMLGTVNYNGSKIQFYNNGELVGENDLMQFSSMESRHILAELCGVKEYDDFWLLNPDGSVRIKANEVIFNGLNASATAEDVSGPIGKIEGIKYQFYRNKECCPNCGAAKYTGKYPEQRELIDVLYGRKEG